MDFETVTVFDDLTQSEKDNMSLELARAVIESEELKETLAENSADIKSKIKTKQGVVTTLSRSLSLGKIQRQISISRKKDMEKGVMMTIDLRTDKELLHLRRALRPDELQEELELEEKKPEETNDTGNAVKDCQLVPTAGDVETEPSKPPVAGGKGKSKKARRKDS